jgi:hypothetical protein
MSVAEHEAIARREEATAQLYSAQYDPNHLVKTQRCRRGGSARDLESACWTSVTNPTAENLEEANKHHAVAVEHLAASQALRAAEAKACIGVPDEDREMSPFHHREDIASVTPLMVGVPNADGEYSKIGGAVVTFRAVKGMTGQWLQRVVDCHIARNAALGHVVPEMSDCPLVPKDVTAYVRPTETGVAVEIRSDNPRSAVEVLTRAERLHR